MTPALTIDFVSDVSCPWCAVGLSSLTTALDRLSPQVTAIVHLQPFELNPQMEPGGQDIAEHLTEKYGSTPEQQAQTRAVIIERGAEVGFEFNPDGRGRIYNTFNAHRLLHWAGVEHPEHQLALKTALLVACHRDNLPMDADDVLLAAAETAGLDRGRAIDILSSDEFAAEVRKLESHYTQAGIRSVPTMIINNRYVISGCQPADVLEQALEQMAAEALE